MLTQKVQQRYGISKREVIEALNEKEILIPVGIFSKDLGALEAITKYMKENLNMSYSEIAERLERNERTIWTSYKKSSEKARCGFELKEKGAEIPLHIFKNKDLTVLETAVSYLKEKEFKFSEIAKLLGRDQRNIWTIYSRTIKKMPRKDNNV